MKPFVIGDRVRHRKFGLSGVIESLQESAVTRETHATVRLDDGEGRWWRLANLEHVPADPPKFKAGDRVALADRMSIFGTVNSSEAGWTWVDWDSGRASSSPDATLVLLGPLPADPPRHPWAPIPDTGSNPVNANGCMVTLDTTTPITIDATPAQFSPYAGPTIFCVPHRGPNHLIDHADYLLLQEAKRFRDECGSIKGFAIDTEHDPGGKIAWSEISPSGYKLLKSAWRFLNAIRP